MKLELTYIEAANLIRRNLNLNPEVTVVIIGVPIVPTDDPVIPSLISDIDRMCWWATKRFGPSSGSEKRCRAVSPRPSGLWKIGRKLRPG